MFCFCRTHFFPNHRQEEVSSTELAGEHEDDFTLLLWHDLNLRRHLLNMATCCVSLGTGIFLYPQVLGFCARVLWAMYWVSDHRGHLYLHPPREASTRFCLCASISAVNDFQNLTWGWLGGGGILLMLYCLSLPFGAMPCCLAAWRTVWCAPAPWWWLLCGMLPNSTIKPLINDIRLNERNYFSEYFVIQKDLSETLKEQNLQWELFSFLTLFYCLINKYCSTNVLQII